jgi:hypothetical protein
VIVDITANDGTPKTVDEPYCENQGADEGCINFQNRGQIKHQVTSHSLKNQVLRQVARAEANALKPREFVKPVGNIARILSVHNIIWLVINNSLM